MAGSPISMRALTRQSSPRFTPPGWPDCRTSTSSIAAISAAILLSKSAGNALGASRAASRSKPAFLLAAVEFADNPLGLLVIPHEVVRVSFEEMVAVRRREIVPATSVGINEPDERFPGKISAEQLSGVRSILVVPSIREFSGVQSGPRQEPSLRGRRGRVCEATRRGSGRHHRKLLLQSSSSVQMQGRDRLPWLVASGSIAPDTT